MFASRNLQDLLFSTVKCSAVALLLASSLFSTAQDKLRAGSLSVAARVQKADENELVLLQGNTHPLARPEFDQGAVSDDLPLEHMFLLLQRSPRQEQALERFMVEQQDPHSPNYHHWLTAEQLGRKFGPAPQDIAAVVSWLESHGVRVNRVYPSAVVIDISATAGQVRDTFHAEIHRYNIDGQTHIANASDPAIPAGLAPVVAGVASLTDFRPKGMAHRPSPDFSILCKGCPDGADNVEFYIEGPSDFATIYNVNPLYQAKITGKGQRIAVLEDTDMIANDWYIFRYAFGLSSYSGTFAQKHPAPPSGPDNCAVPPTNEDEFEAALDAEWSGAVAPDAAIELASCADTATTFGADMAAYNLINSKTPPPIISYSYAECEADLGVGANEFYYITWQQAAAEGTSMFVAAGDWSAAVCNASFSSGVFATAGISVNGLASTPYNLAAGGTDFSDYVSGTLNLYWNKKNGPKRGSAKSYIPEMTWNESCAGSVLFYFFGYTSGLDFCNSSIGSNFIDIVAGSGGPSFIYPKPSWQSVFGNPDDHKRDLPDVSLFSSIAFWNQDLAVCMSDPKEGGAPCNYDNPEDALFFNSGGGTSFASPQLAGVQALINQKKGGPQGNAAPIYYGLAVAEYGTANHPNDSTLCDASRGNKVGASCVFHDVTLGNTDVPCYGTVNCYDPAGGSAYGVLSTSDTSLKVAYPATPGWDFSTGLGSVNVANVVNAWP